ncbi:hypothetical protein DTU85_22675 [Salmonella enterica subsp. enterica serovar Bareilly]|nr:hypothetical protein [Salmonella enterica subsp. enterica serovar Bareilly]
MAIIKEKIEKPTWLESPKKSGPIHMPHVDTESVTIDIKTNFGCIILGYRSLISAPRFRQ